MSISFDNLELAYSDKSDNELENALLIFRLMNKSFLVSMLSKFALLGINLRLPIRWLIKHTVYRQFCGGENLKECGRIITQLGRSGLFTTLDYAIEAKYTEREFEKTKEEILRSIDFAKNNPLVKSVSLKPTGIAHATLLKKVSEREQLTHSEQEEFENNKSRLDEICKKAQSSDIQIYIDAEQSPIQNAIDELSTSMMEKYNTIKPIVFASLQMYRRDRLDYLDHLIEISKKKNFILGIKLVRGAYWQKEKDRSPPPAPPKGGESVSADSTEAQRSIDSTSKPIVYLKKEDTDKAFNDAIAVCLNNIERIALCAATHNEESSSYLVSMMKKHNIKNDHPNIQFSQLYGMSDNISYNLANGGYNVTKYIPYGPVRLVIPYLIRRAEENAAIKGQIGRELKMIIEEKKRRAAPL